MGTQRTNLLSQCQSNRPPVTEGKGHPHSLHPHMLEPPQLKRQQVLNRHLPGDLEVPRPEGQVGMVDNLQRPSGSVQQHSWFRWLKAGCDVHTEVTPASLLALMIWPLGQLEHPGTSQIMCRSSLHSPGLCLRRSQSGTLGRTSRQAAAGQTEAPGVWGARHAPFAHGRLGTGAARRAPQCCRCCRA